MFYNFVGIAYVIDQVEKGYNKDISELIESISDVVDNKQKILYNIFPKDKDLGKISFKIVDKVFSN